MKKIVLSIVLMMGPAAQSNDTSITALELFAEGVISTPEYELNAAFTPDGNTFYFAKSAPDFSFWTLVESKLVDGKWTAPEILPFSGKYSDADPFVSPDGSKLYFISNRPVNDSSAASKDLDLWVVDRKPNGWGVPKHLDTIVNTNRPEWFPCVSSSGTLYFSAVRPDSKGGFDIYRSKLVNGNYYTPENLGDSINTKFFEIEAYVPPDESYIIFCSYNRPDGLGNSDMYISFNNNGIWSNARHLEAPINSSGEDRHMTVTPDGKFLVFTSTRNGFETPLSAKLTYSDYQKKLASIYNGLGNIFRVPMSAVLGQ
jgi:Tol biopolymer transport system component